MTRQEALGRFALDPIMMGRILLRNTVTKPSPPFHYEMTTEYLDPESLKIVIQAPRGHAKSSLVGCIWPIHHIFLWKLFMRLKYGKKIKHPMFVLLVSKTEGHAKRLLETIKNILEYNMVFRTFFGYHGKEVARQWTDTSIVLDTGDIIMAKGTGQQVVGIKVDNQRPTLILLDDPEDMNNTKTDEAMEYNLRWLLQALVPARDADIGRVIIIGTPQHQRCMVETLRGADGWKSFHYSAEVDQQNKVALWPEQWSWEKLQTERRSLESINRLSSYYREYLCTVIADEEQLFKPEYISYYEGKVTRQGQNSWLELTSLNGKPCQEVRPVNVFMGVDPATSLSSNADYTVIMLVAIDKRRNVFVLPFIRDRIPPSETIQKIRTLNRLYRPRKVNLEATAAQETFRDILLRLEGDYIPGINVKHIPKERKGKRYLDVLEPYFFQRKVYLLPSMTNFKDELLSFGPAAKHDDMIDGLYWAVKNCYPPDHELTDRRDGTSGDDVGDVARKLAKHSWQLS